MAESEVSNRAFETRFQSWLSSKSKRLEQKGFWTSHLT